MNKLSPIVLFVYNRLEHTRQTLQALQQNLLAKESELFIYSDGGKDSSSWEQVNQVRSYLRSVEGFKQVTIIERDTNWGLAKNIINGVTEIVNLFSKVIVLEDDIVTSPSFLDYMNKALDFYEEKKKVWHVSGWNYPIEVNIKQDTFAWRMMNCWGWATWADRWTYYKKTPQELLESFSPYEKYRFDLDGVGGFWSQVVKNESGAMDTWAIFWYATIFQNDGICINPMRSFVENIGFDGSGTNTGFRDYYAQSLNTKTEISFTEELQEQSEVVARIKIFLLQNKREFSLFSNSIAVILKQLATIKADEEQYILYGAGNVTQLILPHIEQNVLFIVDKDAKTHRKKIGTKEVKVLDALLACRNVKILITVIGREQEIRNTLVATYHVDVSNILFFNSFAQQR
jgi:hypothetical protein